MFSSVDSRPEHWKTYPSSVIESGMPWKQCHISLSGFDNGHSTALFWPKWCKTPELFCWQVPYIPINWKKIIAGVRSNQLWCISTTLVKNVQYSITQIEGLWVCDTYQSGIGWGKMNCYGIKPLLPLFALISNSHKKTLVNEYIFKMVSMIARARLLDMS